MHPGEGVSDHIFFSLCINKRLYYHLVLKHTPNMAINSSIVINYCAEDFFNIKDELRLESTSIKHPEDENYHKYSS